MMAEVGYAYCSIAPGAVRPLQRGRDQNIAEQMVSADVEDVHQLYNDLKPVLDILAACLERGPMDQDDATARANCT